MKLSQIILTTALGLAGCRTLPVQDEVLTPKELPILYEGNIKWYSKVKEVRDSDDKKITGYESSGCAPIYNKGPASTEDARSRSIMIACQNAAITYSPLTNGEYRFIMENCEPKSEEKFKNAYCVTVEIKLPREMQ